MKAGEVFFEMIYKSNNRKIALSFYDLFGYKGPNIFLVINCRLASLEVGLEPSLKFPSH